MKQLLAITLLVFSLGAIAQNTATPSKIKGKDLYIQLINTTPSVFVENVTLTKEQVLTVSNIEERINLLLNNAKTDNYDFLMTRDGNTVQLYKYTSTVVEPNVPNYFGKEVYFLSNPTKKYNVLSTKEISSNDLKESFYQIALKYSKNDDISYDAVIISGNTAQYIQYK